ncbi:serine/threonine protein phosphatase I [Rubellimicrobium mesophilum DSM 19309]|uniref:Serine/threonine protein phosphatase I n=1 Tax=Rubellimicrobium mesophilum DSM 19309 TaxID=442562 RepID=A0A017HNS6_9RHOB|nr:metallophosphoesterase [Rubellimicrobium mesophilum]EYD75434.1 serine/threonine protein phosphatase I [Rubellimicrobium mesophilum DSM 19309]
MRRLLERLSRRSAAPAGFDAPLAPDRPLAVIGDVHGRDALLARLLGRIAERAPEAQIVLVGDMIDRGEESAAVLRRVSGRADLVGLRGNHEAMCLEFLDDPEAYGPRWLFNGGLQTLASFGIGGVSERSRGEGLRAARDRLREAMGEELIAWLRARPLWWRSGNVVVAHAGADPARPLEEQEEQALLWGHPRFGEVPRTDGLWVVHGHTILPRPIVEGGRIGVDTGAYATGRLTAALIGAGGVEFLST